MPRGVPVQRGVCSFANAIVCKAADNVSEAVVKAVETTTIGFITFEECKKCLQTCICRVELLKGPCREDGCFQEVKRPPLLTPFPAGQINSGQAQRLSWQHTGSLVGFNHLHQQPVSAN